MSDFSWNKALAGELGPQAKDNAEHCQRIAQELEQIVNEEDWKKHSIWDYLQDNYGVRCVVDQDGEVLGVRVCIAWGGPNVYINSYTEKVELYWWVDEACYPLSKKVVEALDVWGQDYFETFILANAMSGRRGF